LNSGRAVNGMDTAGPFLALILNLVNLQ